MADAILAAATVVAVVAVAAAIPALLRAPPDAEERAPLTPSLVMVTGGAAITFAAYLGHHLRCGHRCERGAAPTGIGSLHGWWHHHDAWQWSVQLTIAAAGFALAAYAFVLAARGSSRARRVLRVARAAYALWAVLVFAAPAVYELVNR